MIDDWDLDLDELYYRQPYLVPRRRNTPKLVHKILFSMPAGTPPRTLLAAVRNFAWEHIRRPASLCPRPPHRRAQSPRSYGPEGDSRGPRVPPQYPQAHAARVAPGVRPASLCPGDSGKGHPESGAPQGHKAAWDIQTGKAPTRRGEPEHRKARSRTRPDPVAPTWTSVRGCGTQFGVVAPSSCDRTA